MLTNVLQEMLNIISGAVQYLPDLKISIGIALALLLLIYFKGAVGGTRHLHSGHHLYRQLLLLRR